MELIIVTLILLTFGSIFYILYRWHKQDSERVDKILGAFEKALSTYLSTVENTSQAFYQQSSKIQVSHFEQLTELSANQMEFFRSQMDRVLQTVEKKAVITEEVLDRITPIDNGEKNTIDEKEEGQQNPLADFDPSMIKNIKAIQFEGEEEIYPLGNE